MLRRWHINFELNGASHQAVYLQIADAIIEAIRSGRLLSGEALPGSRVLAQSFGVNRNTVVAAIQVLLDEEWLISEPRKGYFVATTIPAGGQHEHGAASDTIPVIPPQTPFPIRFDDGYPDTRMAPVTALARAYRQLFQQKARWQLMGYGQAQGDPEFRKAIAQMLNHQRGMQTDETMICITRGSQMALYLATQILLQPGDWVAVEQPGYRPAWQTIEHRGARLLPIPVDEEGLDTRVLESLLRGGQSVKAVYTTPHHQYPTTVSLSLHRRQELIRLSNQYAFTIIEDDYDNEFHYGYRPLVPLSSFPEARHWLYIGTMSKVVAPALRIGYLAGSTVLVEKAISLRKLIDVQGDNVMEQAVLQLIRDGSIRKHIRKANAHYKEKRNDTARLLEEHLGTKVRFRIPDGGLAFWLEATAVPADWSRLRQAVQQYQVPILLPEYYDPESARGLRLGFGALPAEQIREGIAWLSRYWPE